MEADKDKKPQGSLMRLTLVTQAAHPALFADTLPCLFTWAVQTSREGNAPVTVLSFPPRFAPERRWVGGLQESVHLVPTVRIFQAPVRSVEPLNSPNGENPFWRQFKLGRLWNRAIYPHKITESSCSNNTLIWETQKRYKQIKGSQ